MATVFSPNQEDEEKKNLNQPQQVTNPGVVGPQSSASSAGAAPVQAQPQGAGTSSGRFGNITNYIKANQNFNKEGGGLAGKVAGNIQKQGDEVTKNVAAAVNNFNAQATGQVKQAQEGATFVNQAVLDPTKFAQNDADVAKFQNTLNAEYTGPKSLMDLEGRQNQGVLQSQANTLTSNVNAGQTEKGRYSLLRNMFNKPSYTSGQQNLDNLIIQGNKDQLKTLQNTRNISGKVNQNLNQNLNQTSDLGQKSVVDVEAFKNQSRDALGKAITTRDSDLAAAAVKAQADRESQIEGIKQALREGKATSNVLGDLGLKVGDNTYGLDLASMLSPSQLAATRQNVGKDTDYANIQALAKLSGNALTPELSKIIESYKATNPEQFSKEALYSTNPEIVKQAITDRKIEYGNKVQDVIKNINNNQNFLYGGTNSTDPNDIIAKLRENIAIERGAAYGQRDFLIKQMEDNISALQNIVQKYSPYQTIGGGGTAVLTNPNNASSLPAGSIPRGGAR